MKKRTTVKTNHNLDFSDDSLMTSTSNASMIFHFMDYKLFQAYSNIHSHRYLITSPSLNGWYLKLLMIILGHPIKIKKKILLNNNAQKGAHKETTGASCHIRNIYRESKIIEKGWKNVMTFVKFIIIVNIHFEFFANV